MSPAPAPGSETVSEVSARRLSIYLRGLETLEASGVETVSSHDFARRFHLNSAQIRKDLALFGEFGIRGVGYHVAELLRHIRRILGIDEAKSVIVCGAGHLGQALASFQGFNTGGFRTVALFDVDPSKIGTRLASGLPILDAAEIVAFARQHSIDIAVLAVPREAAARTLDTVADAGIRAVLNFAPVRLKPPDGVRVLDVDLKIHLETLSFYLAQDAAFRRPERGSPRS